ncbi:hypothetical protein [Deinococcus sonorensis]|uniref:Uncharacterized protein n=2 Tax=Deinococcus sonorensis TaxID=309891 RepID=A0AAU7UDA2_9DEIO
MTTLLLMLLAVTVLYQLTLHRQMVIGARRTRLVQRAIPVEIPERYLPLSARSHGQSASLS